MKTDSGLSAYCHGNVDFPNVWERCWKTCAIPIYAVVSMKKVSKLGRKWPKRVGKQESERHNFKVTVITVVLRTCVLLTAGVDDIKGHLFNCPTSTEEAPTETDIYS